jgi:hypothetical protein
LRFWEVVRGLSRGDALLGGGDAPQAASRSPPAITGNARRSGSSGMPVSEYELYFAFAWAHHRDRVRHRPLAFAVARDWAAWLLLAPKTEAAARPAVAYVVSHSHLRLNEGLSEAELAAREGVINEAHGRASSVAARGIGPPPPGASARAAALGVMAQSGLFSQFL